jgi:predicted PurR-regulated permease PerM
MRNHRFEGLEGPARERGDHPAYQRRPSDSVSWGLRVASAWAVRFLAVAAAVLVVVWLLDRVALVTVAVTIAIMFCSLLQPAVAWLNGHRVPRPLAALVVFVLGCAVLGLAGWFVVTQITSSYGTIDEQIAQAGDSIRTWLVTGPLDLSQRQVDQYTTQLGDTLRGNRGSLVSGFFATATSALGVLSGALFCLFALLFLLLDNGSIWNWFVRIVPAGARRPTEAAGAVAWRTLTRYMLSLILLAVINAGTMVVIMLVAGMPLVVPLGVLLFLGSLIPLIGIIVAGAVVALIALVTAGPTLALIMVIALILTVQLEGNLLNPWILGKAVQIHPLAILVTVTAGTLLGGIFGAFVAVPLVAVVNNVVSVVRRTGAGPVPPAVTGPQGVASSEGD